jgi:hypothetical protein
MSANAALSNSSPAMTPGDAAHVADKPAAVGGYRGFWKDTPNCDCELDATCEEMNQTIEYNRWVENVYYDIKQHLCCSWAIDKNDDEVEAKALEILAWVLADEERDMLECPEWDEIDQCSEVKDKQD